MIFPQLNNKRFGYVNLNLEAKKRTGTFGGSPDKSPFLDPVACQKMVDEVHKERGLDFSYGGWMEDRSVLWNGSYLEAEKTYTHLGIDVNVPAGTQIAADFDAEVVKIDDDYPEDGGWGPRVILRHTSKPVYLLHAHLDRDISCKIGDSLKRGDIFAKVGVAPFNGNWFPHLHLQVITGKYFNELKKNNLWHELDGYGAQDEIKKNSAQFPDPMGFISLM